MILDINAYLGHWPFRRLRYNTSESLMKLMEKAKIDLAVVSSASSVLYRNCQEGNLELHEEIMGHEDRLITFACINPNYAGWREDLQYCVDEIGVKGLRLHPNYHDYDLSGENATALIQEANKRGLPISVTLRMEDERQSHWLVKVLGVPVHQIIEAINRSPEATFILTYIHFQEAEQIINACPKRKNFFIETTSHYLLGDYPNHLQTLIDKIGVNRILFGSGMPLKYPQASLLKVEHLQVSGEDKEKILGKNAAKLLKLSS
jgi:predicted TIM-barrel fold metal-dependent hydrolase